MSDLKKHVKSKSKGWKGNSKHDVIVIKTPAGQYQTIGGKILTTSEVNKYKNEGVLRFKGQYQGGRKSGSPNLIKTDSGFINQHGIEFSMEDRKSLERAVNRANSKRVRMLEEEGSLPRLVGGKETGDTVRSLQLMGKESDFIISRRSKSLQQFKSREDYDRYMKNLDIVNSPEYLDERTRMYKRNHIKAIENVFGDEADDVKMKIRMMKPEEYRKLLQSDEMLEVSYVYDPSARAGKLNQIRASLGMKLKEEDIEE